MAICRVNKTKNYTVMSNCHLRDKKLSLKAKGLLSVVLSLPDDWDYSVSGLCAVCGEGETTVKSAIKELKANGYLMVTKVYPGESKTGRIEYVYDFFENKDGRGQKNQADEKQGLENLVVESLGIETRSLPYNSILSTEELSTDNKSPHNPPEGERAATHRRAKTTDYDADGFAAFWAAYPKKAGKADALKAWNKLAPDVVLQEQMGKALEVQKQSQQWRKDGGQYIPMPATWLNGRRWEDEVQTQTQPNIPTDADYVPLFDLGF